MRMHIVNDPLLLYGGKLPTVIHEDRGSQYSAHRYQKLLESKDIQHFMSAAGRPVDNTIIV